MFNTGARVQEIADLRVRDLQLVKPFQVRLFGKGKKERYCPIWPQTATVLRAFCKAGDLESQPEAHVFVNHRGAPLSRFGIRYILGKCLVRAGDDAPNLRKKRLHPHSMRHSTAVALLKSGVDLSTISHCSGQPCLAPISYTVEQGQHDPRLPGVAVGQRKCGVASSEKAEWRGFQRSTPHY